MIQYDGKEKGILRRSWIWCTGSGIRECGQGRHNQRLFSTVKYDKRLLCTMYSRSFWAYSLARYFPQSRAVVILTLTIISWFFCTEIQLETPSGFQTNGDCLFPLSLPSFFFLLATLFFFFQAKFSSYFFSYRCLLELSSTNVLELETIRGLEFSAGFPIPQMSWLCKHRNY